MKKLIALLPVVITFFSHAQNVGIGTATPLATLDVKGNQRIGGIGMYMKFDSTTGKIEWINSSLYVPGSQQLIRHSETAEGLFYNNGQLEYRSQTGNSVFFTNWTSGQGYFSGKLGIGIANPQIKLHVFDGSSGTGPFFLSQMAIESNRETYLNLLSPEGFENGILFKRPSVIVGGAILFNHNLTPNGFQFRVNDNDTRMMLTSDGTLRFNGQLGPIVDLYYVNENSRYGLGVLPSQLQVYTPGVGEDILFGYGSPASFTENMRIKGNGKVGIGISNPTHPLSFAPSTEKKISLYPGNTGDVGLAVGPSLLKIYADHSNADVAFGFDDFSDGFTERMRIKGNGNVGIGIDPVAGKLEIRSGGSAPQLVVNQASNSDFSRINFRNDNTSGSGRSWDIAALTANGVVDGDRLNFFVTGTGNVLSLSGSGNVGIGTSNPVQKLQVEGNSFINGNLGIGNNNPSAPLSFPASTGKKITLYPGATGDVGLAVQPGVLQIYSDKPEADISLGYDQGGNFTERIRINGDGTPLTFPALFGKKITLFPGGSGDAGFGIAGNRLQIFSDNPNADIAFGFDVAGTFNERFTIKPNAALAVNGNIGGAGQLLQSNGNAAAEWRSNPVTDIYNLTEEILGSGPIEIAPPTTADVSGLTKTFTLSKTSRVIVHFMVFAENISCAFCGESVFDLNIFLNGSNTGRIRNRMENGKWEHTTGTRIFTLNPGNHTIKIVAQNLTGPTMRFGYTPPDFPSVMTIQVIPQN